MKDERNDRMDAKQIKSRTGARPEPFSGEAHGARGGDAGYITAEDVRRNAARPSGLRPATTGTGAPEGGGNTGNLAPTGPTRAASAESGATATHREQGVDAGKSLE